MHCRVCQVDPGEDRQLRAEWNDYTTQIRSRQAEIDDLQREKERTRRELGTSEGVAEGFGVVVGLPARPLGCCAPQTAC